MTFEDYCKFSVERYPSLYSADTWEHCKFLCAHQAFIVLGNGMEWKLTRGKNGYLYCWGDKPKAYGKVQYTGEKYKDYINAEIVFYNGGSVLRSDVPEGIPEFEEYLKSKHKSGDYDFVNDKDKYYMANANLVKGQSNFEYKAKRPYPNFSKRYSPAWEIEANLMAPDWRAEMLKHHEHWLDYYTNDPDPHCHVGKSKDYLERWSKLPVEQVQKDWSIPIWDGTNADECVAYLRSEYKEKCRSFCEETVNRLKI